MASRVVAGTQGGSGYGGVTPSTVYTHRHGYRLHRRMMMGHLNASSLTHHLTFIGLTLSNNLR
jgi:hypothetical protein